METPMRLVLSTWLAGTCALASAREPLPHFDLDMTGQEYQRALDDDSQRNVDRDAATDRILAAGNRLYGWIKKVNAARPAENQISLSNAGNVAGIPISSPRSLKLDIVKAEFERLADDLPDEMRSVLIDGTIGPTVLDISDAAFLYFARRLDYAYQSAARWQLLIPYLAAYRERKKDDVRGYYHLYLMPNLTTKLSQFASLPADEKKAMEGWLVGLCGNSGFGETYCRDRYQRDMIGNNLNGFYSTMRPYGEKSWNTFWKSKNPRPDMVWTSLNPTQLVAGFQIPSDPKVVAFLRDNIEDEWRWQNWSLKIDFRSNLGLPHIVFEAGATPHVNAIGGSTITMDANQGIEEYSVRWTIRHEFGHVLGLPDCYMEFYDDTEQAFINYQLDTTDLMCSRAGKMNQRLYDELRQAYFR